MTGNANSYASFRSPSGQYVTAYFDPTHRISGTPQNGDYTSTVTIPQAAEQGTWTLQILRAHRPSRQQPKPQHHPDRRPRLPHHLPTDRRRRPRRADVDRARDLANDDRHLNRRAVDHRHRDHHRRRDRQRQQLREFPQPLRPIRRRLLRPHPPHLRHTPRRRLHVHRDHSPSSRARNLDPPDTSGSTDRVGNNQYLNTTQIATLGYPTTFQQTGVGDLAAPTLTALAISPTTIDTSTAAQSITVTATITDDVTGNANSSAIFRSPSGQNVNAELRPHPPHLRHTPKRRLHVHRDHSPSRRARDLDPPDLRSSTTKSATANTSTPPRSPTSATPPPLRTGLSTNAPARNCRKSRPMFRLRFSANASRPNSRW